MIVGVDFGAPQRSRDQRRKLIAIAAHATAWRTYRVDLTGLNARLLASDPPGWSATELLDELLARPARVVGFDFPFGVPHALLRDARFAAAVGHAAGAFLGWRTFSQFVAQRLPLTDPLDFTPFAAWRDPAERARLWTRRATDVATGGQPPLKDRFQATFQMTLLGNALLSRLWASYKARPDEAVRLGIAACAAAGITLAVDPRLIALCGRYSSGTATAPDHDVADAFVALCTAILHAEGACRPALAPDPVWSERSLKAWEGAIWVPALGGRPSG